VSREEGVGDTLETHPRVHFDRASLGELDARRIVSLVPSLSEALVLLGLEDRLVGVTEYCVYPAQAFADLPRVGGTKDADVRAIVALRPDLVIANHEENTARVVRALAESGIDVWVTYPRTVSEGVRLLEELGQLGAGPEVTSRIVAPVRSAFDEAARRSASRTGPRPKVFCPIWRDPWMSINRDTYIHDVIDLCGGENVYAGPLSGSSAAVEEADPSAGPSSDRRYPLLELSDLVDRQPEVILLPDEPYAFGSKDVADLMALDLPATRAERVHLIDGTLVSWYGPRIAESIRVVAGLFAK
jgi:ABC-type hemin transport system substrate-binding protein